MVPVKLLLFSILLMNFIFETKEENSSVKKYLTVWEIEKIIADYVARRNLKFDIIKLSSLDQGNLIHVEKIGNDPPRLKGTLGEIATSIYNNLSINYTVVYVPEPSDNRAFPNGTLLGLQGAIARNEIDMAFGLFGGLEYIKIISLTEPLIPKSYVIVSPVQKSEYTLYGYLLPFDLLIWFCLLLSLLLSSSAAALVLYIDGYSFSNVESRTYCSYLRKQLWMFFTNTCCQGSIRCGYSRKHSMIVACWALMLFILINAYCGQLIASLSVKKSEKPIDTLQDLADRPDIPLWVPVSSMNSDILKSGETEAHRILWKRINEEKTLMGYQGTDNLAANIELMVQRKVAFLFDRSGIEAIYDFYKSCLGYKPFYISKETIGNIYYSVGNFVVGFPKKKLKEINRRMVRVFDCGLLGNDIWTVSDLLKSCPKIVSPEEDVVKLENVKGVFILWIIGICSAILCFTIEMFMGKLRYSPK